MGFKKRGKFKIFSIEIDQDVLGTVGLNTAARKENSMFAVNPVIGILHQQIERLVAELSGYEFDETNPATLSTNVGYLAPENSYFGFLFSENHPIDPDLEMLQRSVEIYGLPFMRRNADLRSLVETMQAGRYGVKFMLDYRLPVGLFLLGEQAQAKTYVENALKDVGARTDPAAIQYKGFASKLLERLGCSNGLSQQ